MMSRTRLSLARAGTKGLHDVSMSVMHQPLSLPGVTPKSGVPDFGALRIGKVGNIRLWSQSIILRRGWSRGSSPWVTPESERVRRNKHSNSARSLSRDATTMAVACSEQNHPSDIDRGNGVIPEFHPRRLVGRFRRHA